MYVGFTEEQQRVRADLRTYLDALLDWDTPAELRSFDNGAGGAVV